MNLPALREIGFAANRRLLGVQRLDHDPILGTQHLRDLTGSVITDTGTTIPGLKLGQARSDALFSALVTLSCPKFSGLGCLLFSGGYWIDVVTTQNLVGCLVPECGMKSALIVEQLDPSCNIFVGDLTGRIVFPVDKFHFQRTVG